MSDELRLTSKQMEMMRQLVMIKCDGVNCNKCDFQIGQGNCLQQKMAKRYIELLNERYKVK